MPPDSIHRTVASVDSVPVMEIHSHAKCGGCTRDWLEKRASLALPLCLASPGTEDPSLPGLREIEVSLVSDEVIASVHGEFLDDPTPTDVITFHHGEILISVDTAMRAAAEIGTSAQEEVLLYLIHGLLHLNGHTDATEENRKVMHRVQEKILFQVLKDAEN